MEEFYRDRIRAYLKGKLPPEQSAAFEEELKKNDQLLEETLLDSLEIQAEEDAVSQVIRQSVKKVITEQSAPETKTPRRPTLFKIWRPALAVAASLALLIMTGWLIFFQNSAERKVGRQFAFYQDILTPELNATGFADVENQALAALLQQGMAAYNSANWEVAQQNFEAYRTRTDQQDFFRPYVDFYLAQIHLNNGRYNESISLLKPLASDPQLSFQAAARWYLAFSFYKTGDLAQSKPYLEQLTENPEFEEKAWILLEALK